MMKESYIDYEKRIRTLVLDKACFPERTEVFTTSPALNQKVDEIGYFKQFWGDTIVFPIPYRAQRMLLELQEELYVEADSILSTPLPRKTFHITLHDLSSGSSESVVSERIKDYEQRVVEIVNRAKKQGKIRLRTVGIVSMVSSSIVMLFEPVSTENHELLQDMYEELETVYPLGYPLTLYCTLAYFRPGTYTPEQWNRIYDKIQDMNNWGKFEFELDCSALRYQRFFSMLTF